MTSLGKWTSTTLTTVMSTELNTLSSATTATTVGNTGPFDNTGNLNIYADIEINLASFSPAAGAYVALYILEAVDGTDYPGQSASDLRLTATQQLCVIPIGITASTAQRVVIRNIEIPPTKFNFVFDNQTGASLASSGNTVKLLTYSLNLNG